MSAILGRVLAHLWQRNQFTLADELTIHMGKLSDENDRLRAEVDRYKEQLHHTVGVSAALRVALDECVALFESYGHDMNWTEKMDALLAKMRTP